jgi:hypothetical protein
VVNHSTVQPNPNSWKLSPHGKRSRVAKSGKTIPHHKLSPPTFPFLFSFSSLKRRPRQCCVSLLHTTGFESTRCSPCPRNLSPDTSRDFSMQMRNSEESSKAPVNPLLLRLRARRQPVLPVRAWRESLPRLQQASETSGRRSFGDVGFPMGEPLRRLCVQVHLDDTLVQYAACLAPSVPCWDRGTVSFDSDYSGVDDASSFLPRLVCHSYLFVLIAEFGKGTSFEDTANV